MWNCQQCGCQAIAASLTYCPMCFKEREMPKVTTLGGPSNAWEQDQAEPEVVAPVVPEVVQPAPEPVVEPVVVQPEVVEPAVVEPVVEPEPAPSPGPEPAPVVVD